MFSFLIDSIPIITTYSVNNTEISSQLLKPRVFASLSHVPSSREEKRKNVASRKA